MFRYRSVDQAVHILLPFYALLVWFGLLLKTKYFSALSYFLVNLSIHSFLLSSTSQPVLGSAHTYIHVSFCLLIVHAGFIHLLCMYIPRSLPFTRYVAVWFTVLFKKHAVQLYIVPFLGTFCNGKECFRSTNQRESDRNRSGLSNVHFL